MHHSPHAIASNEVKFYWQVSIKLRSLRFCTLKYNWALLSGDYIRIAKRYPVELTHYQILVEAHAKENKHARFEGSSMFS